MGSIFLPENNDSNDAESQAIYRTISHLTGVDQPALIFRTIATIPDALSWCWHRIGPLYEKGLVQSAGWSIAPALSIPSGLSISQEALDLVGVHEDDKKKVEKALDVYNRVNPCNLIALGVLSLILHNDRSVSTLAGLNPPPENWIPPEPLIPLTTMVTPEAMQGKLSRIIQLISLDQDTEDRPVLVPSLYRHLANVPAFLALASVLLRPVLAQGQLLALVTQVREQAFKESTKLYETLTDGPYDPAPQQERIKTVLERFSWKIPEMIVVGEILRRALP